MQKNRIKSIKNILFYVAIQSKILPWIQEAVSITLIYSFIYIDESILHIYFESIIIILNEIYC